MIVIRIAGKTYSDKTPIGITPDYIGVLKNIRLPALSINLRRASVPTFSLSFDLVGIADEIVGRENYLLFQRVEAFLFGDDEDFSQAKMLPSSYISAIGHDELTFKFSTVNSEQLLSRPLRLPQSTLTQEFTEASTLIAAEQDFPNSGFVKIGSEFIEYETRDGQELRSLRREVLGSDRSSADIGEAVELVLGLRGNPVDILLGLLMSQGEGGEYDSLMAGLGLGESVVDIESFETVRDTFFTGWEFDFFITSIPKLSDFIQQEILQATGTRFVDREGKIALVALGQTEFDPIETQVLTDRRILKHGGVSVKFSDIVNSIKFEFGYLPGSGRYTQSREFLHAASIKEFGLTEQVTYRFKGIHDLRLIQSLVERFFARFAFPSPEIKVESVDIDLEIGKTIILRSDFISGAWGKRINRPLEILKKSIEIVSQKATLTLAFTNFITGRVALISASPKITSHDIKTIDVESSKGFDIGFRVRIFDRDTQEYVPGIFTVQEINNNAILLDRAHGLGVGDYFLSFADYPDCTETQRLYAFINQGDENFEDGEIYYQIT